MPSPNSSAARAIYPIAASFRNQDQWLMFNQQLSRDAAGLPNEAFLDQMLEMARDMAIIDPRIFWLTLSRIGELAVKLAGDYADSCEFQAAGDLLVNPRRIDVYQRSDTANIQKDRHRALSEQFAAVIGTEHPVAWLKRETHFQIKSEALLPSMIGLLRSSGYMTDDYLADFERRMCRISDTIAFLSAWQVDDNQTLFKKIRQAGPEDRTLIMDSLCRFDDQNFIDMGEDIEKIVLHGQNRSRFLKRKPAIYSQ